MSGAACRRGSQRRPGKPISAFRQQHRGAQGYLPPGRLFSLPSPAGSAAAVTGSPPSRRQRGRGRCAPGGRCTASITPGPGTRGLIVGAHRGRAPGGSVIRRPDRGCARLHRLRPAGPLDRLATHGQHGVVAAPGRRYIRGACTGASPCPLKASHGPGRRTRTALTRRRRARSAVTMRWSHVCHRAWPRPTEPGERQIKIFFPELVTLFAPAGQMTRCHRRRSRYPHSTSSEDSFVRRLVSHEYAGDPRP